LAPIAPSTMETEQSAMSGDAFVGDEGESAHIDDVQVHPPID